MNCQQYAIIMANYNQWMNQRLYQLVATLTDAQRKQDCGAFFGSIHHTLNHLLLADQAWLQRFQGQPVTMKSPRDIVHDDFVLLQQTREQLDEQIVRWAQALPACYEDEPLGFYSVTYQKQMVMPLFAAVMQFFNHQTHHRGQITTLLSQRNIDIGVTDLPMMPYFMGT
ncbi:DinB family protein [Agitococcus lubricus]|uniref:Putative damage-inducible protein DinB n=1 Tax=Agitococcus lubricus TaxID=1077255 RepID=A0A2T5J0H7_9GAMM|nr:DinB family protein [Agitococcus lubricus]PTQ89837.1 putative damage-inducible protein DinB [Agitococcus lubricus]